MIYQEFFPLQEKVEMYMNHRFAHKFNIFVHAFMKKYNDPNSWVFTTIWKWTQLDDDRFAFVRRYDSKFSSQPTFERIIINRKDNSVEACMLDDNFTDKVAEKWVYKADGDSTIYETFLYKNPGWKSYLRRKAHSWGVDRMTSLLAKEKELFLQRKEMMLKKKEIVVTKTKEELKNLKSKLPLSK